MIVQVWHQESLYYTQQMTYAFSGAQSQDLMQEFHFRMVPHVIHLAVGLSRFVSIFNWTRVVIITQIVPVFDEVHLIMLAFKFNYLSTCKRTLQLVV